ncbi:signal transduction histidine kinase [Pedobacter africanus]|uniref:Signal transduction histidine kinase n=1 Tax=Pedobacter africanus TaxID=151894 RepID=A0ACC6KVT6_9SPHI|nr:HAMP domain-containing sensor histidine kinase [Pedobacter africanus]MDR6783493.1 signal transduction histidine kinase [Pedobacter africanus]
MKLQFKLALYNTLTKVAIITMLGILILVSINRISINHIQQRLIQKKRRLVANLSGVEVNDLLMQKTYTDYNLLREEYIILKEIRNDEKPIKQQFTRELRSIESSQEEFQILTTDFNYEGRNYRLELGETMSTLAQLERTISMFTFGILIAAVILTLITDLAFTRFLLTPFYRIIDQKLNKVNEPTNFNYKPVQTSTEDFRILDRSISALMRKITGLFLTEKEFIANVSHELLTPISVLNTRLENLLNDEKLTPEGENKIFASLKTLGRLKAIINSLLLISKVENNQYSKPDTISVRHTVEEVYEELEHRLLMMKLKFNIQLQEDHTFTGNRSLFHTLITNLISNAIKYNIPSGSVNISDMPAAETYTLVIADTGIGMNTELLEHAFVRFEKLESEREDSHGLGLAIVRSIATFHELKIDIKSKKGKGTEIRINFPQ